VPYIDWTPFSNMGTEGVYPGCWTIDRRAGARECFLSQQTSDC
jgi:hypothetical protein